ncbi:ABC transporter permease [Solibaculum mannosilyticum]|uniref:ABC transporter permease n=1 Tax=Solibaculum mannosilyticum TaxID=2780922 RepID=UPI0007A8DDE6|nr:FtsX-like permease family protein [Eubacteriaceae bacterium CHKCI005]
MKFLYLLLKQHSRFFLREIIIMLQIVFLVYSITMVTAPIAFTLTTSKQLEHSIHQKAVYMSPYLRIQTLLKDMGDEKEKKALESDLEKSVASVEGLLGQGKMGTTAFGLGGSIYVNAFCYNEDLIKYTKLPLSEGKWFSEVENTERRIPVILGGKTKNVLEVGQEFPALISMWDENGRQEIEVTGVVIGKLADEDLYFRFDAWGEEPLIEVLAHRASSSETASNPQEDFVLTPLEAIPEEVRPTPMASRLLFLDPSQGEESTAQYLKDNFGDYSVYHTIPEIFGNQNQSDLRGANTYVVLSGVLFLLCIFGLGGYLLLSLSKNEFMLGVYYLCGMRKRQAFLLYLIPTFVMLLIPTVVASFLSPSMINVQNFIDVTTYISILILVLLVFFISVLVAWLRIRKMEPVDLIRKGRS